jgi:hypothetical protein
MSEDHLTLKNFRPDQRQLLACVCFKSVRKESYYSWRQSLAFKSLWQIFEDNFLDSDGYTHEETTHAETGEDIKDYAGGLPSVLRRNHPFMNMDAIEELDGALAWQGWLVCGLVHENTDWPEGVFSEP